MIDFAALNNWGRNLFRNKLVVACGGGCGRVFTAAWDSGIRCQIVSLQCKCGHVTPIDGSPGPKDCVK